MGKSNQLKLLLFKGAILASMLALLAGVVGTVYAQSSTGSSSSNLENDSNTTASNTTFDEQQEALWINRSQSLIPRVILAINGGKARGRSTTDMENALSNLQTTLAARDTSNRMVNGKLQTERGFRAELRANYNFLKRAFNIYRATFPDQFTTSTTGVASTGGSACTTAPSTSSASPTAEATGTMAAVPATGSSSNATTSCTCAAPNTVAVATATPVASVATTGCAAPSTGSTSSSSASATATPMPTVAPTMAVTATTTTTATTATTSTTGSSSAAATAVPTATATVSPTATMAPAAPATGSTSSNCAAPAATATPVPSTTTTNGCAAPATGSTSSSSSSSTMSLDQFNAFVWNNRASTLIARVNVALNSNRMSGRDTTTMTNDLANLRSALAESVGTQRTKDVQETYTLLKRDLNQFRAANPELFTTSNTGVANTGSTSTSGTCNCAPSSSSSSKPN